ncbi:MAG: DinB family protein [Deltaproteobacteria bacterium]
MSSSRPLPQLTRYKRWADELIFQAVQALPPGEVTRERPTLFKTLLNTLNHIYVVDLVWQAHLEGRQHGISALNTVLHENVADLWRAQQTSDDWYVELSDSLSDQALCEVVPFEFLDGNKGAMSRADMLLHVVNHTTYHRGWVADMFFQIPLRPPTTDLPVFLRG